MEKLFYKNGINLNILECKLGGRRVFIKDGQY